jgi:hypothetical protein
MTSHPQERTQSFQMAVFWVITPCKRKSLFQYVGETCNLHLQVVAEAIVNHTSHQTAIPAPATHCRAMTREPYNYKRGCAYANGFSVMAEGTDMVNMSIM